ncbi:hypothetical protein NL676_032689 [Syzygium grande]|nr:hypothetical protein NL676_032689 [Syzygium grande]
MKPTADSSGPQGEFVLLAVDAHADLEVTNSSSSSSTQPLRPSPLPPSSATNRSALFASGTQPPTCSPRK